MSVCYSISLVYYKAHDTDQLIRPWAHRVLPSVFVTRRDHLAIIDVSIDY